MCCKQDEGEEGKELIKKSERERLVNLFFFFGLASREEKKEYSLLLGIFTSTSLFSNFDDGSILLPSPSSFIR